jgi:pimeloyl-ACP methyl ester carboxylesterase
MPRPWILVLLLLTAAATAGEPSFAERKAEFLQRMAAAGVSRRAGAAKALDPTDPRTSLLLYEMLVDKHWYVRSSGTRALAGTPSAAARANLRLDLVTDERPMVREGIAFALGIEPAKGDAKALAKALTDEHWTVRRAAARSLGEITSREAIAALIERLDPDEHPRVRMWAAWSLRSLTGQTQIGPDRSRWRAWWKAHATDPGWGPLKGDAEVKRRELAGIKLETVTVTRTVEPKLDLLVLSYYGYRDEYLRPYLDELGSRVRLTYVRLPSLKDLTGVPGYEGEGPIPRYPVDKLVRALEQLRREFKKDRIAIMAHGATGWIALRYAKRYPKRTQALVLVNSWLDALSYTACLTNMLQAGSPTERFVAQSLMNQNSVPKSPAAYRAISRIMLTSSFTDHADLDAAHVWWGSYEPQGFSIVPDVKFPKGSKLETPTLFLFSMDHPMSGHISMVRIRQHMPNVIIAPMRRSLGHPYIEEPKEFLRLFDGFVAHFGVRR